MKKLFRINMNFPPEIWLMIFSYCPEYKYNFRHVCRNFNSLLSTETGKKFFAYMCMLEDKTMLEYHSLPSKTKFYDALKRGDFDYYEKYKDFFLDDVLKALRYAKIGGNSEIVDSLRRWSFWRAKYIEKDFQVDDNENEATNLSFNKVAILKFFRDQRMKKSMDCDILFLEYCDKNFVYYNLNKHTFPNLKRVYLNSHPCEPDVFCQDIDIYLTERNECYKYRWAENKGNVKIISEKTYNFYLQAFCNNDKQSQHFEPSQTIRNFRVTYDG